MKSKIPIVIMAAGSSTRMGTIDKRMEIVDGRPLILKQVEIATQTNHPVFVALKPNDDELEEILPDTVDVILAHHAPEGLSGSLRDAVHALPDCPAFLIVLADLVLLTTSDLLSLLDAFDDHDETRIWRATTENGKAGHPVLFSSKIRGEFNLISGDTGAKPIVKKHAEHTKCIALPGNHALFDLDTPQDWETYRNSNKAK